MTDILEKINPLANIVQGRESYDAYIYILIDSSASLGVGIISRHSGWDRDGVQKVQVLESAGISV